MKAIVCTKYGAPDVLQLQEVEKPAPKEDEVLIKIYATTVTAGDCELRSLKFPFYLNLPMRLWRGLIKPRGTSILGTELAGEIEAVEYLGQLMAVVDPGQLSDDALADLLF